LPALMGGKEITTTNISSPRNSGRNQECGLPPACRQLGYVKQGRSSPSTQFQKRLPVSAVPGEQAGNHDQSHGAHGSGG
jgi:hypothetical protein